MINDTNLIWASSYKVDLNIKLFHSTHVTTANYVFYWQFMIYINKTVYKWFLYTVFNEILQLKLWNHGLDYFLMPSLLWDN